MENKVYNLVINGKEYRFDKPEITGEELLKLIGIHHSTEYEILMKITDCELAPIELTQKVDLEKSGIESFNIKPYHEIVIEVDDEKFPVTEIFMTPKDIMVLAGLDTQKHYLKQIVGHTDITYKNDADHIIGMVDCMKFSSCKIASTPVS